MFVICDETIMYLLLRNLHDYTFNPKYSLLQIVLMALNHI